MAGLLLISGNAKTARLGVWIVAIVITTRLLPPADVVLRSLATVAQVAALVVVILVALVLINRLIDRWRGTRQTRPPTSLKRRMPPE